MYIYRVVLAELECDGELGQGSAGCPILGGAGKRILVLGSVKRPGGVEMGIRAMQDVPAGTDG